MNASDAPLFLPALRGHMGDWAYYVALIKLKDVASRVRLAKEIHTSQTLNDLIQREVTDRAGGIRQYLLTQDQRFFNALVIAVYGGSPDWYELDIGANPRLGVKELPQDVEGALGILVLQGGERLFALDGQHRVVGIQEAVQTRPRLGEEEVTAVFVGHKQDAQGLMRTRRLFTTLNRYAKPVSVLEKIALDEDDIVAIVTRRIVDEHLLFKDAVSKSKGVAISANDRTSVTTIGSLYDTFDAYLKPDMSKQTWENYKRFRPNDREVEVAVRKTRQLIDALAQVFNPLREIARGLPASEVIPRFRNQEDGGHLILRPIGLKSVVIVLRWFMDRGLSLREAARRVAQVPMSLSEPPWVGLLWDPTSKRINYREENQRIARWVLFHGAGGDLSSLKGVSERRARTEWTGVLYPENSDAELVELPRYRPPI